LSQYLGACAKESGVSVLKRMHPNGILLYAPDIPAWNKAALRDGYFPKRGGINLGIPRKGQLFHSLSVTQKQRPVCGILGVQLN
jgi:hypothetical protein